MKRSDFPTNFQFGVATSSYQIEGHTFGGAGRTHWDDFAATAGNVVGAENGAIACDHYHRFEEDFDLVEAAGFDSYRFSASWARVLPEGRGRVNEEGLDYYDRLVDALVARGIKPYLTLYHWELPSPLADVGGWRNRDIAFWFADYAEILLGRIGDRVHAVTPINEPWCVSWLSHMLGHHAPGLRDIRATARSMHHVQLAHGTAIQAMRAMGQNNLGALFNFEWADAADDTDEAKQAAARYDAIYNRFFIESVLFGRYPHTIISDLEPFLPEKWQDDMAIISSKVDWLGINYYTRKVIQDAPGPWPAYHDQGGDLPKTQMGWEVYPQGLASLLERMKREYQIELPIYITENGMANADEIHEGKIDDEARWAYIKAHLEVVRIAAQSGLSICGYFVWSLLDNYEWALGYEKRFGLVHVDFESLKRTPKKSYERLRKLMHW